MPKGVIDLGEIHIVAVVDRITDGVQEYLYDKDPYFQGKDY